MPYSPPLGSAVNFTVTGHSPVSASALGLKFPAASYTPPGGAAVQAQFPAGYTAPSGAAVDFSVPPATEFVGSGAVTFSAFNAAGSGEYQERVVIGAGAATVDLSAAGAGVIGVTGNGAVTASSATAAGAGVRGVAGQGAVTFTAFSASGAGIVERYELKGEVRLSAVLVNRRVRAYRRDTGALINEGDTVAGRFRLHTGFAAAEYYVIPIDLAAGAADWAPPCANRLVSVLAQDS